MSNTQKKNLTTSSKRRRLIREDSRDDEDITRSQSSHTDKSDSIEDWTTEEDSSSEEEMSHNKPVPKKRLNRIIASPPPESSSSGAYHIWQASQAPISRRQFYKRAESTPSKSTISQHQDTIFIDETAAQRPGSKKRTRWTMTQEETETFYRIVLHLQEQDEANAGFAIKPGNYKWKQVHEEFEKAMIEKGYPDRIPPSIDIYVNK
jgi:hypothetical protein